MIVLGGFQTDFARHAGRDGHDLSALTREAIDGTLAAVSLPATAIDSIHLGNAFGELFSGQAHLAAMPATVVPALWGVPAVRTEAACASGGLAVLSALQALRAGASECALVLGVEQQRHVPMASAAQHLGAAAWVGHEAQGHVHVWPHLFSRIADAYAERYGLDQRHLRAIAAKNYANAKRNPLAQTRAWALTPAHFSEDDAVNPVIDGRVRRQDCSQLTDGAAGVVLATQRFAREHAARTGHKRLARLSGWGHRTGPLPLSVKLNRFAPDKPYLLGEVRGAITDAFARANIAGPKGLDGIETHDCFTISEYIAMDHFGITKPGEGWRALEAGTTAFEGALPVNPSGGLIGGGHPVGATGVRMVLDAAHQVMGRAGATQVENAKRFATCNLGGSGATAVCFIVERADP